MVFATLTAVNSYAEIFGSMTGRSATFSAQPQLSIEAAITDGELFETDFQQLGVRLNYQYTPKILMFGDIGKSELSSESETSFGFGAFYSLGKSILGIDSAVKASFHQVSFDSVTVRSGGLKQVCEQKTSTVDGLPDPTLWCRAVPRGDSSSSSNSDFRNFALEYLSSGAMPNALLGDSTQWYMNGGLQLVSGAGEDDKVVSLGAGMVFPLGQSEVFTGVEYADEIFIGAGFRYLIK